MTFKTFDEAKDACEAELEDYDDLEDMLEDARGDLQQARDDYDEAGEFLDDSTAWDVAAAATVAAACLSNPFSWVICGIGIVGGGAAVVASEGDRQDEIAAAKRAVEAAEDRLELVQKLWADKFTKAMSCVLHHMSKGAGN